MMYQNKRTGYVLTSDSVISGNEWEEVKEASSSKKTESSAKKKKKVEKDEQ